MHTGFKKGVTRGWCEINADGILYTHSSAVLGEYDYTQCSALIFLKVNEEVFGSEQFLRSELIKKERIMFMK
jgi:hypothetical protein